MVQWVKNQTAVLQHPSALWAEDPALPRLWVTAAAQSQSLAWELPCAACAAIKKKQNQKHMVQWDSPPHSESISSYVFWSGLSLR